MSGHGVARPRSGRRLACIACLYYQPVACLCYQSPTDTKWGRFMCQETDSALVAALASRGGTRSLALRVGSLALRRL